MTSKDQKTKLPMPGMAQGRPTARRDEAAAEAFEKEVLEEIQREKLQKLWDQNKNYILAGAFAIVLGVGGYKWFESQRIAAAEARGNKLWSAVQLLRDNKAEDATKALSGLAKEGGPAAALANIRLGATAAAAGKTAEALAAFEAAATDKSIDPLLAEFARLQTAMLKVDTADWTEMQNRLNDLATDSSPWRHSARELLGLSAMKAGRTDDARANFEKLLGDRSTPQGLAERARIAMATLTAASLAKAAEAKAAPAAKADDKPAANTDGKADGKK